MPMKNNIKLLIADDSKVMRDAIAKMFSYRSNIKVVAEASNGLEAIELAELYKPDVITMDVAMPKMDGMTALKHIMIKTPVPTVMLSSLTLEGARVAFDALRFGAVDFISKPSALQDTDLSEQEAEILSKVEYASNVEVESIKYIRETQADLSHVPEFDVRRPTRVISMGASEGGYGALLKIIPYLGASVPYSYLVTMYTSREHLDSFASYLNHFSQVHVKRAAHDEVLRPGVCYLNSGVDYMTLHDQEDTYTLHISPAPFASRKGAVDMLLFSTAEVMGESSIGVILSGMGQDGSEGLKGISHRGGTAIVQDPRTCLCDQMVQSAIGINEQGNVVEDNHIASFINSVS